MKIIAGKKPLLELLETNPEQIERIFLSKSRKNLEKILTLCRQHKVKYKFLPEKELNQLFAGNHQGCVARLLITNTLGLEELLATSAKLPLILALDCVQDPQNVGSLIRTLVSLGGQGLILPQDRTAYLGEGVVKSSAGAIYKLRVSRVVNLGRALLEAQKQGYFLYASLPREGDNPFTTRLQFPAILVLGNEDKGIRPGVLKKCPYHLTLPMPGEFESLNVAQAGGILMAEFLRQYMFG